MYLKDRTIFFKSWYEVVIFLVGSILVVVLVSWLLWGKSYYKNKDNPVAQTYSVVVTQTGLWWIEKDSNVEQCASSVFVIDKLGNQVLINPELYYGDLSKEQVSNVIQEYSLSNSKCQVDEAN